MAADYAHTFCRVTISGTCFNGAEHWSTGFQSGFEAADVPSVDVGAAEAVSNAWETFFENSAHHIPTIYRTTQVKVALIGLTGVTDEANIDYYFPSAAITGGSPDGPMPPQITLAATMTSNNQRGLASKGRMYLPGYARSVDGQTGRIPSGDVNTLNTGFKLFLDTVNDAALLPGFVIIASKGHKTQALDTNNQPVYVDGVNALVTGCRIGDVFDTQRRRRNELGETYNTKVLEVA